MSDIPADKSAKDTHYAKLRRQFRDQKAGGAPQWRERPAVGASAVPAGLVRLYGLHTVRAALDNPARIIKRMLVTNNALDRLEISDISALPFTVEITDPKASTKKPVPTRCIRAWSLRPSRWPPSGLRICQTLSSFWSSTRSPTRTMSAPSCARLWRSMPGR